jgi:hypothetical protein
VHILTIVLKGLAGGTLVALFALFGEVIRPRSLAGIASAAPSVAGAGLLVTMLSTGLVSAHQQSLGMIAGAVGLLAWCLVGADVVKRFGSLKGSIATTAIWFAAALASWGLLLR